MALALQRPRRHSDSAAVGITKFPKAFHVELRTAGIVRGCFLKKLFPASVFATGVIERGQIGRRPAGIAQVPQEVKCSQNNRNLVVLLLDKSEESLYNANNLA